MVDTHTHIYLPEFDADRAEVVEVAWAAGVRQCWLPAIDEMSLGPMSRLSEAYPGRFVQFAGLHPTELKPDWRPQLAALEKALFHTDIYQGIGEIGLDFYWDASRRDEQLEVLRIQLDWAVALDRPVLLHVRSANDEMMQVVREYYGRGLRGVFHCYSGTLEQARELVSHGFLLGVNGSITYKKSAQAAFLRELPLECLLTETDAPYLSPVPLRGRRNEPANVRLVVEFLARLYGKPAGEVDAVTSENAARLLLK